MEKIKLGSGKELDLIICGIIADAEKVTIKFLPGADSLDALNTVLLDKKETEKMTLLSESGDELSIYNGYTQLCSISMEQEAEIGYNEEQPVTGRLVTAVLKKQSKTEQRIASLEETVDMLVMESLGM